MIRASFNGDSCTAIVYCYTLTNTIGETEIINFYNELAILVWHITKQRCNHWLGHEWLNRQRGK